MIVVKCERPEVLKLQATLTTSNSYKEFYRG